MADVCLNAGVRHACWQAGKRLGAAQAYRELEYLQRVEKFEDVLAGPVADNILLRPRKWSNIIAYIGVVTVSDPAMIDPDEREFWSRALGDFTVLEETKVADQVCAWRAD